VAAEMAQKTRSCPPFFSASHTHASTPTATLQCITVVKSVCQSIANFVAYARSVVLVMAYPVGLARDAEFHQQIVYLLNGLRAILSNPI